MHSTQLLINGKPHYTHDWHLLVKDGKIASMFGANLFKEAEQKAKETGLTLLASQRRAFKPHTGDTTEAYYVYGMEFERPVYWNGKTWQWIHEGEPFAFNNMIEAKAKAVELAKKDTRVFGALSSSMLADRMERNMA